MRINKISGLTAQESQHHDTCNTNPLLIHKHKPLNRQNKKNMTGEKTMQKK